MEADGKAVLTETGTFMVDRARALEKLMRFALPDPAWGVLSLVRFAVASQAQRFVVVAGAKSELTVRFDGTPPTRAQLERPYDALFARAGRTEARGRDLAVGLLSLLRLEPAHILVRAGHGEERLLMRLNRAEPEAVEAARDSDTDTVVRFIPGPRTRSGAWDGLARAVSERCAMLPFVIVLDGQRRHEPRPPEEEERRQILAAGVSGWARIPGRLSLESRIRLYRLGVLVGETAEDLGGAPVDASVDCPGFRMNASQTAVVRDPTYRKALAAVAEAAARLVGDSAARHADRAPLLAPLLRSRGLRGLWERRVAAWLEPGRLGFVDALASLLKTTSEEYLDPELSAAISADARRACWLREAAARPAEGAFAKAASAARDCPVFLAPDLTAQTRAELEETVESLGVLPAAARLNAAPRDYRVLWTCCPAEREAAERWFPGTPVSAADDALAFEGRARSKGERKGSLLSRLGVVEAVARRPLTGAWEGEVALPLQRPDAARIHVFSADDELAQSIPVPGPLRFVAAVTARGPIRQQHGRFAVEAVAKRLEELYAAAATDWSPGAASPRSEALRAHLIDGLAHWGSRAPSWLESLPLFQCEVGLLNLLALRHRLDEGDTLFFAPRAPAGPAPQLLFAHPSLTEELVRAVLPAAKAAGLPGRTGWTAAWRPRPAGRGRGGLEALEDVLREHGTFLLAPGTSERRHLLEAVVVNFAPWAGEPRPDPRWQRVREHLAELPLFTGADGAGLTPPQLAARVAAGRPLPLALAVGPGVELVLDKAERPAFAALWPEAAKLLVAAPEAEAAADAKRPGAARLAFADPMLAAGEVEAPGLRALVGLPPEPLPGVSVTLLGAGPPRDFVLDTPGAAAAGRMLLDVSGWPGGGLAAGALSKDLAKAARELYIAFMERLVSGGCDADPAGEGLRPYLLMLAAPRKGTAAPWAAVRQGIDALPLFPTLGGGTASLGELRRTAAKGVLRCARAAPAEAAPAEAAHIPVVTLRTLVEAALGTALHDWSPETAALQDGTGFAGRLETLLTRVRGRKGLDPALAPRRGAVRLEDAGGAMLLAKEGPAWRVNAEHPAARLALAAGLDETSQAAYLLSALATAANRSAAAATDAEDALFQALLAEAAAEEG